MNAPLPRTATTCAAISEEALDLTRIFDPGIQIAQWWRPVNGAIADWLNTHADHLGSGFRQILAPGKTPDLARLPAGAGRDALAADLTLLAEMLGELLDARSIGLRLEVVGQAMCPRLHVDRVGIRLLCTYRGPGTEWVDDAAVDRGRLGAGARGLPDESSGLLGPGSRIEVIPPFAVALLKGSLWQGNGGRGVIHRSPAVTPGETPRVLLAMDADW
ncbi:DUF1826 domain-containing protein [Accumulibacter sp.]|uniref:DUF1826 domain-containing protein n=1 Tax=Accumulibacter regalis TaxID=522306 RepID=C7RQ92_ACCRE|nr:DUF1826 domain-containing protein [Accumulibacter sp.]MBN8497531.1 DUF1826 domain-containing protein [Accumulibacter sp.]MBO3717439.1 DUF1826 domain-containing protein [Accumulibacter sp.]